MEAGCLSGRPSVDGHQVLLPPPVLQPSVSASQLDETPVETGCRVVGSWWNESSSRPGLRTRCPCCPCMSTARSVCTHQVWTRGCGEGEGGRGVASPFTLSRTGDVRAAGRGLSRVANGRAKGEPGRRARGSGGVRFPHSGGADPQMLKRERVTLQEACSDAFIVS